MMQVSARGLNHVACYLLACPPAVSEALSNTHPTINHYSRGDERFLIAAFAPSVEGTGHYFAPAGSAETPLIKDEINS
jgi:hypothetical protein